MRPLEFPRLARDGFVKRIALQKWGCVLPTDVRPLPGQVLQMALRLQMNRLWIGERFLNVLEMGGLVPPDRAAARRRKNIPSSRGHPASCGSRRAFPRQYLRRRTTVKA